MTSATRELLAERYHLEERIASGGMGVVWRARDERLCRDVAIKLIRPEYADDPTFRQRLQLEAKAIAAIRSPYVIRIHDVCEEQDPNGGCRAFLVMELIDGAPLSAVLREGTLTLPLTLGVVRRTASALAAAHEQQIVHRDIKPANLMLDAAGRVTVLDFGIARAADTIALTATDLILGTARYISPEQADGRTATAASDVYSLGVVAFQCLAGKVPFDAGSDVAVALAHLRDPVPALPANVPAPLASLVTRMLAKSRDERPTATEVAEELSRMSADADTSDATVPIPRILHEVERAATAVMPLVMSARHRVRDRLAGRDLRETRSAPLRLRMSVIPAIATAVLAVTLAFGGASSHPQPAVHLQPAHTTPTQTGPTTPVNPVTHTAKQVMPPAKGHPGPGPGPGPGHVPPGQMKKRDGKDH